MRLCRFVVCDWAADLVPSPLRRTQYGERSCGRAAGGTVGGICGAAVEDPGGEAPRRGSPTVGSAAPEAAPGAETASSDELPAERSSGALELTPECAV